MATPTDVRITAGNVMTNVTALVVGKIIKVDDPVSEIPELVREFTKALVEIQTELVEELATEEDKARGGGGGNSQRRSGGGSGRGSARSGSGGRSGSTSRGSGRSGGGGGKASAKQVDLILDLLENREHDLDLEEADVRKLSIKAASELIDELFEAPEA
jgi:uncharacterized membrane protein YgcG